MMITEKDFFQWVNDKIKESPQMLEEIFTSYCCDPEEIPDPFDEVLGG